MPILKPIISLAVAGAIVSSAYSHLTEGQRGQIAAAGRTVMETVDSGVSWLSATFAALVPYRLPQLQPNGDIVIKRLPPEPGRPAERPLPDASPPPSAAPTNT